MLARADAPPSPAGVRTGRPGRIANDRRGRPMNDQAAIYASMHIAAKALTVGRRSGIRPDLMALSMITTLCQALVGDLGATWTAEYLRALAVDVENGEYGQMQGPAPEEIEAAGEAP